MVIRKIHSDKEYTHGNEEFIHGDKEYTWQ